MKEKEYYHLQDLPGEFGITENYLPDYCPIRIRQKHRVNILALGDVGRTMLIGLRLLGGDVISEIGICDINEANVARLEMEMNQIRYPEVRPGVGSITKKAVEKAAGQTVSRPAAPFLPLVRVVTEDELFDCDVFLFCASRGVPAIGVEGDVRMAQLDANREIIRHYADLARTSRFQGMVCVISDPVDPLARAFLEYSGLRPEQIQGYGLGVMNARAMYYAERDTRFSRYLTEGRAYGPHGQDLIIADSLTAYDDKLSRELTEQVVSANMKVRDLGYKPYIAPALSSAALSVLLTLRGEWHYGSLFFGAADNKGLTGAYLGVLNRMTPAGPEYEEAELCPELYERIRAAYGNLTALQK